MLSGLEILIALLIPLGFALLIPLVTARIANERKRVITARALAALSAFLLIAILLPGSVTARADAQRRACIANLKILDGAKIGWSLEMKQPTNAVPTVADLAHIFPSSGLPVCPAGGTYTLGAVNEPPRCSHADKGHTLDIALPKASP